MKSLRERTEIQQAYLDGIRIEHRVISSCNESGSWYEYAGGLFDWTKSEFRIKPKPMEIWVNVYNGSLVNSQIFYRTQEKAQKMKSNESRVTKFIEVIE